VAVHPDGALACVGDLSGNARVWDLRSGLALAAFEAHAGTVTGCDFAADGFSVATASGDHSAKIWDLRARRVAYTLPAHGSVVSDVRFRPDDPAFVLTSGYDGVAAVWSRYGRDRVVALQSTAQKAMRAAWCPSGDRVAVAGYDCTWKLWDFDGEIPEYLSRDDEPDDNNQESGI
jgi:U4/U6 small nuclear ribonucleoprotein PRP4